MGGARIEGDQRRSARRRGATRRDAPTPTHRPPRRLAGRLRRSPSSAPSPSAAAAPAAAIDDPTRPDARVTHGPSCRPGGVVVEVVAGTVPYAVTLATTRAPGRRGRAPSSQPGETVVLRTGDVAWGETIDGRLEYTAARRLGRAYVDELEELQLHPARRGGLRGHRRARRPRPRRCRARPAPRRRRRRRPAPDRRPTPTSRPRRAADAGRPRRPPGAGRRPGVARDDGHRRGRGFLPGERSPSSCAGRRVLGTATAGRRHRRAESASPTDGRPAPRPAARQRVGRRARRPAGGADGGRDLGAWRPDRRSSQRSWPSPGRASRPTRPTRSA